jgi:hypothetical protein
MNLSAPRSQSCLTVASPPPAADEVAEAELGPAVAIVIRQRHRRRREPGQVGGRAVGAIDHLADQAAIGPGQVADGQHHGAGDRDRRPR